MWYINPKTKIQETLIRTRKYCMLWWKYLLKINQELLSIHFLVFRHMKVEIYVLNRDVRVQILIWFQTFLLFTKPHFQTFNALKSTSFQTFQIISDFFSQAISHPCLNEAALCVNLYWIMSSAMCRNIDFFLVIE